MRDARGRFVRGVSQNVGADNPAYRHGRYADGGVSKRNLKTLPLPLFCEECAARPAQLWHHVDEDRTNNARENLRALCRSCHAKVHSFGGVIPGQPRDPVTGQYLRPWGGARASRPATS